MPVSIDVIAVKNNLVNEYEQSQDFNKDDSLINQLQSSDGSKLYIYDKNRNIQINNIDPNYYVWISIDDEDDFSVNGEWSDIPFNLNIDCQMSFIIDKDDQKLTNSLIEHFNDSPFDTSNSFNTTFIAIFNPSLKEIIEYREIFDDLFVELALGEFFIDQDDLAFQTFYTNDSGGIYDQLSDKEIYDIQHWLNLDIYGLQNVDYIDWDGDLNLSSTDIKIV